ncbi:hypothetical protein N657DRAFT_688911 [Parathielavia appendiculata]|uniref:SH3 domain-containing protein n=1 Tax=Parathielavia appendiculata TaxID=2587402 RepID=A0AAN6U567_9PEZI|nr:hypothetical protein N657DRAFT_688911 [Parathielavia appendiculata]
MQFKYLLTGALLPLGLLASPTPETEASPDAFNSVNQSLNPREFTRPQECKIIGSSTTVNCRRGPGTKYSVERTLRVGTTYDFWCVRTGECVTINGFRNCGWDYSRQLGCYVSGHYTSSACSLAGLGGCGGADDEDAAGPFS